MWVITVPEVQIQRINKQVRSFRSKQGQSFKKEVSLFEKSALLRNLKKVTHSEIFTIESGRVQCIVQNSLHARIRSMGKVMFMEICLIDYGGPVLYKFRCQVQFPGQVRGGLSGARYPVVPGLVLRHDGELGGTLVLSLGDGYPSPKSGDGGYS